MVIHDIVLIGGSAGALEPLAHIVELLPKTLAAAVLVVIHTSAEGDGLLADILSRRSRLPVDYAGDHARIVPGRVYIAPPDYHLLANEGELRVVHGPRENGFRPAIDPLFRTAARAFGPRVVGVVLSGALGDGAYGLSVVKHHGGVAIVQDPDEATFKSMPSRALLAVKPDYVAPAGDIAAIIDRLSQVPTQQPARQGDKIMARPKDLEPQLPSEETAVEKMEERYGAPSSLTCPDCGGALWEVEEGRVVRYQCHVGHQYSPDSLDVEQRDAVDSALWSAVRILEEHAELKHRLARRAAATGLAVVAKGYEEGARDAHGHAQKIRSVLFSAGENGAGAVATTQREVAARRPGNPRKSRKIRRAKRKHKE